MDHFNKLTPAEAERLAMLAEECGEVIQVIGKILRHGYESSHPVTPNTSNRDLLEKELGDVDAIMSLLSDADDIFWQNVELHSTNKLISVKKWTHHQ